MKTTKRISQIVSVMLLCVAMIVSLMSISVSADSAVTSVIIDGETLNEDTPFLVDTGAGYVADDGTLLGSGSYTMVAKLEDGVLTLVNYNGGAISTDATGDLTVKLMGENTILHKGIGIDILGGNLTITADAAATLNIQSIPSTSHADEAPDYVGIANNFENGYATVEKSGDSVTITGYAAVSISSTKTYANGSVTGIGAYGGIMVLENASLNIAETNDYTNLAKGINSLNGMIVVNTTGDVDIAVCGEESHDVGENIFLSNGTKLGRVGKMTLNWTYAELLEEAEVELDAELSKYVIGTIPEDDTSATYGYKFPIAVTGGVAKMGDETVEAAAKGEVITVVADAPEAGQGFYQWSVLNEAVITFADEKAESTTFEMIAGNVELEAIFTPAYTITTNNATASASSAVSGSVVTVTADAPQKGYQFAGWIVQSGEVVLSDPASITTSFVMGDAAVEITATYEAIPYFITVNGGEASIDDAPVTEASIADTVTLVADTPPAGMVFKEWLIVSGEGAFDDAASSTTTLTGVFGNVEIVATYEDAIYTITVTNGTASAETAKMGDEITITAASVAGKTFQSWTVASGGVTLDSTTSATTTFVVGTENVEITAAYTYIDYTVSIKDGMGQVDHTDGEITNAHVGDIIQIAANDPESGYAFIRWNVLSGEAELEDPTSQYTSFKMTAGNVELEAVYAEIVVLEKLRFTITVPVVGEHPTFELIPQEPEKYGSDYVSITLNKSPYTELGAEDRYMLGNSYCLAFQITLANGYKTDGNTKVYLNGEEMNGNPPWWQYYFDFPVPITVIGGKAYEDSDRTVEITEGLSQYVYLKADEVPEGKVFLGWIVKSGDVTIYSANYAETAEFYLKNEPVTVEAVFADVLEEVVLTVTTPKPGDLATIEITSADPSKYTAELIDFYINKSPYTQLTPTDPFEYGKSYTMQFEIIAAEGYAVTEDTVVTVNGDETYGYGGDITGYEKQRWTFELPVSITVVNGKAYTSSEYTEEIVEFYSPGSLYIKADEAPEGKEFLMWKITTDGDITYNHYNPTNIWVGSASVVVCEAIYAIPINTIELTMPKITVGSTPITTVTTESDLYTVEVEAWYNVGDTRVQMLPTDTYVVDAFYECRFIITPKDGYCVGNHAKVSVNGKTGSTGGYHVGTAIVGAYVQLYDLIPVGIEVTGGKLYLDGVETNETEFLPGTTLTLVADKSLYPEGETFTRWYFPSYSSTLIKYTDERAESFTFTICEPPARDRKVTMEAQYAALTSVNYLYTYVPHPVVGGTPSYDAGVDKWKNYFAEVLAWYEGETLLETDHVFEAGKTYTVKIRLESAPGYYFPPLDFEYLHADNTFSGNSADGILLERGENGEYIIFESSITAKQFQENMSVTVTTPVAGMLPSDVVEEDGDVYCDVEFGGWLRWDEEKGNYVKMVDGELFAVGETYRVDVKFASNDTYFIDYNNITVLINGKNPVRFSSGSKDGGLCTVGYYLEFTVEADGSTFDLEVENGSATVDEVPVTEVGGGITVTITADAPEAGKAFKEWIVVSGENVVLIDATASTTTFVMPAGNVQIQAVYRNTPHAVTVEGGTADLAFAGSGETITITAGEAPDGKYFAGWECTVGGVTFSDATAKTTTFVMTGEAVTIKAIYADKILLETVELTIAKPDGGNNPTYVITSADPEKYTAEIDYWWDSNAHGEMSAEDTFAYGNSYYLYFEIVLDEKYYINGDTVVEINNQSAYYSSASNYPYRYTTFRVFVPITVEGGYATDGDDNHITSQAYNSYVELIADDAPEEGQCFSHWEVVVGGITISYPSYQSGAYFIIGKDPVTVRAIYHTHTYDETYKNDNTYHWFACTDPNCPNLEDSIQNKVEHVWDNACDTACNTCEYVRTTYHNYNNYVPQKDATCTETGMKAYYECTVCHTLFDTNMNVKTEQELIIAIDSNAHDWGDWTSNGDGTHTRICSHNNEHTATADCTGGEATCTAAAICSTCNVAYGNAKGHTYGEKVAQADATCLVAGMKAHYHCSVCDTYFDENKVATTEEALVIEIDPTAHNWGAWNSNGDGTHTRLCTRTANHKETDDCKGGTATCTQKAVCTTCQEEYGTFKAHELGDPVAEVPATHTKDALASGMKAHYQCAGCDAYFDIDKNPINYTDLIIPTPTHSFGEWIKDNDNHWKTCECGKQDQLGEHVYDDEVDMICNTCGYDRTVPHTHGNGTVVIGQAATCTEAGWKDHYKCSCGKLYTEEACQNEITDLVAWKAGDGKLAALSHAFGGWTSNGDGTHTRICSRNNEHKETENCSGGSATCTEAAICSACGTAYGQSNGHSFGEATCTKKATCSVCGTETGDLKPHSFSEATCTAKAKCSVCGTETGDLKPHSFSEATCIAKAKCSVCGTETGDFGAHAYGTLVDEVPATHTTDELLAGIKAHYHCSVCDKYFDANKALVEYASLVIPAPVHVFGDWVKNNENHWKVCECGKKNGEDAHIYDDEADMLCNTCGYDRSAPHTHGNGTLITGQAATCTTDGWKDYYQCSCGHIYTDEACTNEITNLVAWKATEGAIAASHTLGELIEATEPDCTNTGMKAHYRCSVCNAFFDEEKNLKAENELHIPVTNEHSFTAWVTNGDGTHTRVCSRNAEHKETAQCSGGEATCLQKAICANCNTFYGEMKEHAFSEATCTVKATCTYCGTETGELAPHSYSDATCTKKATCSICGAETGALADHVDANEDGQCDVCHYPITPLPEESTPEPEESTPEPEESTPEPEESTPEPEESTPEPEESTPEPEESTPEPEESTPEPEESTPLPEESTPDPEESTPLPEESTPEPEESTPESEGTSSEPEPPSSEKPEEEPKKGISGGAIAGIVVGSTAVAAGGGFAVWWFAIQKHTVAELGTACKSIAGKIGNFFKDIFEQVKKLFAKK